MGYTLKCWKCGHISSRKPDYKCGKCGNIQEFEYDLKKGDYRPDLSRPGIFRYHFALPCEAGGEYSLGEGNTPLIPSRWGGIRNGIENLHFKLECDNPSASFKDRGLALAVQIAHEAGANTMIIASSGNASASAAAYAARSGIPLYAVVPEATPDGKITQALTHGATVIKVNGVFSDCYALCREMADRFGYFDLTTTFVSPFATEGYKTIGFEIYDQLGRVPDWILLPVGAGPVLAGVHHAFCQLMQMGETDRLPRLVCVQAAACGPISGAFLDGLEKVVPCTKPQPTMASGINDSLGSYADDGDYTIACIRECHGTAVLLNESEIERSVLMTAGEGIYAEPAGAVCTAAAEKLAKSGVIGRGDTVVSVVTGHGLKNPIPVKNARLICVSTADEAARAIMIKADEQKC
jgi:threonine synthase